VVAVLALRAREVVPEPDPDRAARGEVALAAEGQDQAASGARRHRPRQAHHRVHETRTRASTTDQRLRIVRAPRLSELVSVIQESLDSRQVISVRFSQELLGPATCGRPFARSDKFQKLRTLTIGGVTTASAELNSIHEGGKLEDVNVSHQHH